MGRVLIEIRRGVVNERAAPRPTDTVLPQEQPAVLSAQRKAADRERQARERQHVRNGAAETLTVYATEHARVAVLRWVAYHLTAAQLDDVLDMTERELWYEISLVLIDALIGREPTASIGRMRRVIDERFKDLRLTPPLDCSGEIMETCEWKLDIDEFNSWESSCGHSFWFEDGTPAENEMKFCPYCGRNLTMRAADPPSALEDDGESKESAGG